MIALAALPSVIHMTWSNKPSRPSTAAVTVKAYG